MNLDDAIYRVRNVIDDDGDTTNNPDQKWSDAEIVDHLSQQQLYLTRIQVERGRNFHNFTMGLQSSLGRQLYQNVWQYRLPTWCSSIASVYLGSDGTSAGEVTSSPYIWTSGTPIQILAKIPKLRNGITQGYTWDGVRTLRLWGFSTAPRLFLDVAKLPAPLFKASLPAPASASSSAIYLPDTLTLGRVAQEEGAYINGEVQMSTTTTIANSGVVQRCVYSQYNKDVSGTRKHELTFDTPWPGTPVQNDIVQSVLSFGDEHARALILLAANACFEKKPAIPAQKAIQQELSMQLQSFVAFATRKDQDGPDIIGSDFSYATFPNQDRTILSTWSNL